MIENGQTNVRLMDSYYFKTFFNFFSTGQKYDPQVAMKRRAEILDTICNEYSNPINPEFFGLYGSYFESENLEFEVQRVFLLAHNTTACVPNFTGSQILSDFLSRIGSNYDVTDSMDPCSAFHFLLRSLEPDRSDEPIPHPDYPGITYALA
jgi:hypothetical protein